MTEDSKITVLGRADGTTELIFLQTSDGTLITAWDAVKDPAVIKEVLDVKNKEVKEAMDALEGAIFALGYALQHPEPPK